MVFSSVKGPPGAKRTMKKVIEAMMNKTGIACSKREKMKRIMWINHSQGTHACKGDDPIHLDTNP